MLFYLNGRITLNIGEGEDIQQTFISVEKSVSNRNFDLQKFLHEVQAYLNLLLKTSKKDIKNVDEDLFKKFKLSEIRVAFQNGSGFTIKK